MTDAPTEDRRDGKVAAAIADMTVHLLSEYTGRGPTRARTHLSGDLVAVVLQDNLTKGERSLVRDGEEERVLQTRQAYQRTMREDLAAGVAKLTGREVVAFMSANHIDPDVAVEIFILAPDGEVS
ncbi:MAG TPA: Na-translocating system protein MpsC family protein [Solirubrobacteraceae bacterium]